MSTTDLNTIAENLAELLTTVTSQTSAFYNLFLSTTPQDVTFLAFDANNQLVEVTIPNRAKDRQIATSGNGSPEGVVEGNVGEAYVDQQYNQIYYKISGTGNTGWTLALTQASVEALLQGYVPKTRTVNNKMLNENITLTASDINAMASTEKLGKSLEISGINLTLKDQDGVALSSVPIVTTGANKDLSNLTSTGYKSVLPDQTSQAGKFLTTNGDSPSWAALTALRVLMSNASGNITASDITSTELGYLDGVTSNIQTQIGSKLDAATYNANPRISSVYCSAAGSGYIVWSNGFCIQWGSVNYSTEGVKTVSFVKTWKDTSYAIVKNLGSTDGNYGPYDRQVSFYNLTTTTAQTYSKTDNAANRWIACGYLASGQY